MSAGMQCLAADFSGAAGVPAVVVLVGIDGPKPDGTLNVMPVKNGGAKAQIVTAQSGKAPEVKTEAGKVIVGVQAIAWDGKAIAFGK